MLVYQSLKVQGNRKHGVLNPSDLPWNTPLYTKSSSLSRILHNIGQHFGRYSSYFGSYVAFKFESNGTLVSCYRPILEEIFHQTTNCVV